MSWRAVDNQDVEVMLAAILGGKRPAKLAGSVRMWRGCQSWWLFGESWVEVSKGGGYSVRAGSWNLGVHFDET